MKCPQCGKRSGVEIDLHSGGFSSGESPIKECAHCKTVWRIARDEEGELVRDIIHQPLANRHICRGGGLICGCSGE